MQKVNFAYVLRYIYLYFNRLSIFISYVSHTSFKQKQKINYLQMKMYYKVDNEINYIILTQGNLSCSDWLMVIV